MVEIQTEDACSAQDTLRVVPAHLDSSRVEVGTSADQPPMETSELVHASPIQGVVSELVEPIQGTILIGVEDKPMAENATTEATIPEASQP